MASIDKKYRYLEIIPGALVWTTLFVSVFLSFFKPLVVVYFILAFDLYWLIRVAHFVFYLGVSWKRYKNALATDWAAKLRESKGWSEIRHIIFLPTYKESFDVV